MIASTSWGEPRAMSRYLRKSFTPRRDAPSAMFRAALYAARLHWSAKAYRSSLGSRDMAAFDRTAKSRARCHAFRSLKLPMLEEQIRFASACYQLCASGGALLRLATCGLRLT